MNRVIRLTFLLQLAGLPCWAAGPPRPPGGPLKAVLVGGRLLTCKLDAEGSTMAFTAPVRGGPVSKLWLRWLGCEPFRWHAGHGGLWVRTLSSLTGVGDPSWERVDRFELKDALAGRLTPVAGAAELSFREEPFGGSESPARLALMKAKSGGFEFPWFVAGDVLPCGPTECRAFVLRNFRRTTAVRADGTLYGTPGKPEEMDATTPHWALDVHRVKREWDPKAKAWAGTAWWHREGSLPVLFREPFQMLGQGGDYYFLTDSGRLFRSPRPAAGRPRGVELVWADDRRVEAVVQVLESNRAFLFCHPARPTDRPTYFELGPRPKLVAYDPASVERPKAAGDVGRLLTLARVLAAHGKAGGPDAEPKRP